MKNEEWIKKYYKLGLNILPAKKGKKYPVMPTWKRYQRNKATEEEIQDWIDRGVFDNINLCLGSTSNVWEIDVDVENVPETVWNMYPKNSIWVCQSSMGKVKVFFKSSTPLPTKKDVEVKDGHVELRGDNHLSVLPPSIHPSGEEYIWLLEPKGELAPIDGLKLYESIVNQFDKPEKPEKEFKTVSKYPQGSIRSIFIRSFLRADDWSGCSGHSFRLALCAELIHGGYSDEEIHRLFETHDDWSGEEYSRSITQKKIDELRKKNMKTWTWDKLKDQCPEQVRE